MEISFVNKIKLEKHYGIILLTLSSEDGQAKGIYVKSDKVGIDKIKRLRKITLEELEKQGEIIAEFEGKEPPKDVVEKIETLLLAD